MFDDKKIDKPSSGHFYESAVANLPGDKAGLKITLGVAAILYGEKALKNVSDKYR